MNHLIRLPAQNIRLPAPAETAMSAVLPPETLAPGVHRPPPVTWAEIETVFLLLAGCSERVSWEMEILRRETAGQPPEFYLRRLFALAWSLLDDEAETMRKLAGGRMS